MSLKIYIDGKLYDKEDAKISVYDHGLLYGDGVFEGIRSYGGKVFRLAEHLDRLWDSAKAIWLEIPMSKEEMAKAIEDTLAVNGIKDGYIRVVVTRGVGTLGLDPNRCSRSASDHHRRLDLALSRRSCTRRGWRSSRSSVPRMPSGRAQPADQVAELPEQHPGEDRGASGRLHRGADAQPQGRNGRMHRRQHLPGAPGPPADAARSTPAFSKASPATRSSSLAREMGIEVREIAADQARRVHRRRVLPDRHGGRSDSGGEGRQPHDRRRQFPARSPAN